MKITHIINKYGHLTGSELYVYELTREQAKKHEVSIYTNNIAEGELTEKTRENGVEIISGLKELNPDIIHTHQSFSTGFALASYDCPVVQTVHSEVLPEYEYPVRGAHYISIRPGVQKFVKEYGYDSDLVFNPFDFSRFNKVETKENNPPKVLFIGALDHLRAKAIKELSAQYRKRQIELIGIGDNWRTIRAVILPHTFNIEEVIKSCDYTAGVQMGRSTIEGWLCGKPGIVYEVDNNGNILDKKILDPPDDLSRFDSRVVAEQIENIYDRHLHSYIR